MKLSDHFRAEFRHLIDEVEPWLESQGPRQWNKFVIYVTDTTPEFETGKADQKVSARILPKTEAIAWERQNDTPASRELLRRLLAPQQPGQVWIIASTATNAVNIVQADVFELTRPQSQTEGDAN